MPWIDSKFPGTCAECGDEIEEGDRIYYNGKPYCATCGDGEEKADKSGKSGKKARLY